MRMSRKYRVTYTLTGITYIDAESDSDATSILSEKFKNTSCAVCEVCDLSFEEVEEVTGKTKEELAVDALQRLGFAVTGEQLQEMIEKILNGSELNNENE